MCTGLCVTGRVIFDALIPQIIVSDCFSSIFSGMRIFGFRGSIHVFHVGGLSSE